MIIKACKECPFFQNTLLAMIATKGVGGVCSCDGKNDRNIHVDLGLNPGTEEYDKNRRDAWRRMKIPDPTTIPDACPLRTADVTITLGH